jgi:hypothetical protein
MENQMKKTVKNLDHYINLAGSGTAQSVDSIMNDLNMDVTIAASKIIDYSLGFVRSDEGLKRMAFYLFNGTQMQRNYCAIFFNRRGDWQIVREAYLKGLIDYKQYFSR